MCLGHVTEFCKLVCVLVVLTKVSHTCGWHFVPADWAGCATLRVHSVTVFQHKIPAKSFFRPNIILCEKLCCLVMFSHAWKCYLGLIMPANTKYDLDPWFRQDCMTVWRHVWLVWCNTHIHQQNFLMCRDILRHVLSRARTETSLRWSILLIRYSLCKLWEPALVIGDRMTDALWCAYWSSWSRLLIIVVLSHSMYLTYYTMISRTCVCSIKEAHCCP